MIVWMKRLHQCRGFGVQSPFGYSFIRYVINEHYPYYAYADLEKSMPYIDKCTRKLGKLYFRIANYLQPKVIYDYCPTSDAYNEYFRAGCKKAVIVDKVCDYSEVGLARITLTDNCQYEIDNLLNCGNEHLVIIVENIYRDTKSKDLWKSLIADERTGITFDLYYAGLIFLDKSYYKMDYVVNF